ncbi:MAG: hypothetical protein D8M58_18170 [Calditrichaeota bacterium]|nr:MAG: hypothetical protein DWQ03_11400 [Calditrichota bacterium]MBL1207336.1 hypothetical protein [Calditrichota bacterium]NOG47169.1 hypothetical protein [Calditrichota bacterium]
MSLTIRLFSDVICPFCYIAEQTVMKQLAIKKSVSFLWLGMELHPETSIGGVLINDARYSDFRHYVQKFAADFGMDRLKIPDFVYNTHKLLLVAEYAREQDKLEEFRNLAYKAYWQENVNIEDDLILSQIVTACGMDGSSATSAFENLNYKLRLEKRRYNALQLGIKTLPGFMWGKKAIIGCHPYSAFEKTFQKE